jgi:hypothetical protein
MSKQTKQENTMTHFMTNKQWDEVFYHCPGAWVGNKPSRGISGNIVVDGGNIVDAIRFLTRHRFQVLYAKGWGDQGELGCGVLLQVRAPNGHLT